MIFEELQFCHFSPPKTSFRGNHSQIQLVILISQFFGQTENNHTITQSSHVPAMDYEKFAMNRK